jgi:hypothetical protein
MAGWGTGSFENEDAQNWLGQLKSLRMEDLRQIFAHAGQSDYIQAPQASVIVAAAEVLAALKGAPSEKLPPEIADWITHATNTSSPELNQLAIEAVDQVRRNSELKDLWLEAEGLNEWSSALRDLGQRLAS